MARAEQILHGQPVSLPWGQMHRRDICSPSCEMDALLQQSMVCVETRIGDEFINQFNQNTVVDSPHDVSPETVHPLYLISTTAAFVMESLFALTASGARMVQGPSAWPGTDMPCTWCRIWPRPRPRAAQRRACTRTTTGLDSYRGPTALACRVFLALQIRIGRHTVQYGLSTPSNTDLSLRQIWSPSTTPTLPLPPASTPHCIPCQNPPARACSLLAASPDQRLAPRDP